MSAVAALVLAAGKGTRMKSDKAKVIFELAGKTLIERVVETAIAVNCDKICVVVGHQKEKVMASLDRYPELTFADQAEQLGTGHAVMVAEDDFKGFAGDILILAGDVPLLKAETLLNLTRHHQETGASCTVLTGILDDAGNYGRIIRDKEGMVTGIVEYKDATPQHREIKEFNTGIWCFRAQDLFDSIRKIKPDNNQREYYLTDALAILVAAGNKVESVLLEDQQQAAGINSQQQLAELEDVFLTKIKTRWLNSGVMIHNPSTVFIGEDVNLEPDVTIEAHTVINGKSYLERGCHIGPHCYLENAGIGSEAILRGFNIVIDANVHASEIIEWSENILEDTLFPD